MSNPLSPSRGGAEQTTEPELELAEAAARLAMKPKLSAGRRATGDGRVSLIDPHSVPAAAAADTDRGESCLWRRTALEPASRRRDRMEAAAAAADVLLRRAIVCITPLPTDCTAIISSGTVVSGRQQR